MSFFSRNLQIFKRIGLPLYVLTLVYTSLDQLLTINTEAAMHSQNGASTWMWVYGFSALIVGIIFPVLGSLVVIYGSKTSEADEKGLWNFIQAYVNQLSIEILRSWGKTLLWSLFLILPGIWRYIELAMIPYVVTLSQKYDRGEEDALAASTRIVRANFGKVLLIFLVFHLLFPSMLTVFFDDYRLLWRTPISALILTWIDVYLFIFSTQLLLTLFETHSSQEASHAAAHV